MLQTDPVTIWRDSLRPPELLGVAEWAEKHLRLAPKVTNFPGPYRADLTPYVRGIFDAFLDPAITFIYLCFGAQTAKTTAELVCLCYTINQDPGPAMFAMPSENLARSFSQTRLKPLIDATPELAIDKPADDDLYKTLEMHLRHCVVALVGGNSPSNLASRPIRYLIADEVDKFPVETTREGSALNLAIRAPRRIFSRRVPVRCRGHCGDDERRCAARPSLLRHPGLGAARGLVAHRIRHPAELRRVGRDARTRVRRPQASPLLH